MERIPRAAFCDVSNRRGKLGCLLGALACSLILASVPAGAQDGDYAAARAGIRATLDNTLAAMRRGASVEEVAPLLFTDDAVVAVPGSKESPGVTFHGLEQFKPTLAQWIREPIVSWTIEEPFKVSGDLAVAYIIGKLAPTYKKEPGAQYRALWVFEKGPNGWRCSREAQVGSHSPDYKPK
jgi:ketosteroid isomerase-like protein